MKRIRSIQKIVKGKGADRAVFEPRTRSYVKIRDVRTGGNHPVSPAEVEMFLEARRSAQKHLKLENAPPPPGGLGAGITFKDGLLHFRESTAAYYYLVAPPTIGLQSQASLLYMTSSNAAWKGCEALLSFFADEQFRCVFRIWDWAHPDMTGGGKFVKGYAYSDLSDYLIPCHFQSDTGEQLTTVCLYILSVTQGLGGAVFQNEVYLHNHTTGTRDLVWSYAYQWPDKDAQREFWWGPIFETFPNPGSPRYALTNPVGFDGALVVQDGVEYQLTDVDSALTLPQNNGLVVLYRSGGNNSGLVCQ